MMWKNASNVQDAAKQALVAAAAGGLVFGFVFWSAGVGLRAALLLAAVPIVRFLWVSGRLGGGR